MPLVTDPNADQLQSIARSLRTNRSRNHVKALAAQYGVEESYVEMVAEYVGAGQFRFAKSTITESVDPKGSNMPDKQATEIVRVFRESGTGPAVQKAVATAFGLTESAARVAAQAFDRAKAVTEADGSLTATMAQTDAAAVLAQQDFNRQRAQWTVDLVNRAEAKGLQNATTQELEAVAFARFSR